MIAIDRRHRIARTAGLIAGTAILASLAFPAAVLGYTDSDHDGLSNKFERTRSLTNPYRADTDRDGIRDGKEDPDHDGLRNRYEFKAGTNPRRKDSDGDGIKDGLEDPDHDGLTNLSEQAAQTDPRRADSDGDGIMDGLEDIDHDGLTNLVEQRLHTNPRNADTDGDRIPDGQEDPDHDGLTTLQELARGTDPLDPDSDHDGILDGDEVTPGASAPVLPGAPGCTVLPADNVWNLRVDALPVAAASSTLIGSIGSTRTFHMDFGSYAGYGIPYQVVDASTPRRAVTFDYADESDPGPYPIPSAPLIEAGSDRHLIAVDRDTCRLYELFDARQTSGGAWLAGSGAQWDLGSNALRPAGWTSADAAGLPILPGLVRYDEVAAGEIDHALRFTAPQTRAAYIYPARHFASSSNSASLPPMGLRVRLKATANLSGLSPDARVIAVALQRYGMILADNGSPWYVSGMSDPRFDDDVLHELDRFTGADLEVVDTTGLVNGS
jgi:Bacterial TSP3 repeat